MVANYMNEICVREENAFKWKYSNPWIMTVLSFIVDTCMCVK